MMHFSLAFMNRLNKPESAIFILYFGLFALDGPTVSKIFIITTADLSAVWMP